MAKNAVVYCVTGSHMPLVGVSITSLVKNYQSSEALDILVLVEEIAPPDVDEIRKIPSYYNKENISIFAWYSPKEAMNQIEDYDSKRFPPVTLWRLFIPSYFPDYEKILFLDNDTIIRQDISGMFEQVQSPNVLGAVRDFYFRMIENNYDYTAKYGIKNRWNYFNGGVILFNVSEFNKVAPRERLVNLVNEKKEYVYPDQSILNHIAEDRVHYFDFEYNYQKDDTWLYSWAVPQEKDVTKEIENARENIVIRHYVEYQVLSKPWEHLYISDQWDKEFWNYFSEMKNNATKSFINNNINN
ncbi:glycosyltransferase family 8 protein [Enterococcus sp. AZ103]|uniref:glycosyltransferase family 8 protein n=1 Tax=Enterococcus sp. AZ103 TaxID=2774628 RepID=UPI003F1E9D36